MAVAATVSLTGSAVAAPQATAQEDDVVILLETELPDAPDDAKLNLCADDYNPLKQEARLWAEVLGDGETPGQRGVCAVTDLPDLDPAGDTARSGTPTARGSGFMDLGMLALGKLAENQKNAFAEYCKKNPGASGTRWISIGLRGPRKPVNWSCPPEQRVEVAMPSPT
ncbi:hypothetical protein [Amycolatopsis anabasis]|uniref:hypothetical protein n=1 Tax=Amycolatopsis anabasis TaxID=1840409 RepID=UPI00131B3491|nr:hypothetical protein [Amycolatopsis anabasis]